MEHVTGAVKLKDGLFFGDEYASQDLEFVVANKVTRIVNCCARQVPNHFDTIGVEYIGYPWMDNDAQIILDLRNAVVNEVTNFIEQSLDKGESVLVHSFRGQSRCVTVLTAYLMRRYKWTLNKALQYVQSRREDIAIKPAFHRQLMAFERRLAMTADLSSDWESPPADAGDDLIMYNTFLNSKAGRGILKPVQSNHLLRTNHTQRLVWSDNLTDDRSKLEKVRIDNKLSGPPKSILKKSPHQIHLEASPVSTAASTPTVTPAIPSLLAAALRPATPKRAESPMRSVPPPLLLQQRSQSPSVASLINRQTPLTAINGLTASAPLRLGPPSLGPVRVGRTLVPAGSSSGNFSPRTPVVSNLHIRPPSPMVSHSRSASSSQPFSGGRRPLTVSNIRPPSPARSERETTVQSLNRPLVMPQRTLVTAGQFRRAPSPMTAAMQSSLRPQSAPLWRSSR